MRFRLHSTQPALPRSLLSRILTAIMLVVVGAAALVFGAAILAILLVAAVVFFAVLYLRAWQLRRRLGLNVYPRHAHGNDKATIIEGEYTVTDDHQRGPKERD